MTNTQPCSRAKSPQGGNRAVRAPTGRSAARPRSPGGAGAILCGAWRSPSGYRRFDAYLAARPDDLAARDERPTAASERLMDRYFGAHGAGAATEPSPERVTQLVEFYRLHGRVEDEIGPLQTYAGKGILDRSNSSAWERFWPSAETRRGSAMAGLADRMRRRTERGTIPAARSADPEQRGRPIEDRALAWMAGWRSPFPPGKLISG